MSGREERRAMVPCKDLQPLVDAALAAGWRLRVSVRTRHVRLLSPDGVTVVAMSSTPGNPRREFRNVRAGLRRGGVPI